MNKKLVSFLFCVLIVLANFIAVSAASFDPNASKPVQYFTTFDGIQIAYTDEGEGEPVMLIHGFINSGASWKKTQLRKDLLKAGYRVIAPDLRGNGNSDKPQEAKAYAKNAEIKDLMTLKDHLNLMSLIAIGYSRGSIVLAKWLSMDKSISKAVIGGMGLDFSNPKWERRKLFADAFAGRAALNEDTEGAVNYAKSIGADIKALAHQQDHQPVTKVRKLKKINTRTLVIAGDQDKDNGSPQALNAILGNSVLKIVPGDHNGTYKTEEFSKVVMDFIRGK